MAALLTFAWSLATGRPIVSQRLIVVDALGRIALDRTLSATATSLDARLFANSGYRWAVETTFDNTYRLLSDPQPFDVPMDPAAGSVLATPGTVTVTGYLN